MKVFDVGLELAIVAIVVTIEFAGVVVVAAAVVNNRCCTTTANFPRD